MSDETPVIKSFRDLRIWQAGMLLAERIYLVSRGFPKDETYGLRAQLRRAVISVPSNIAEGHTRSHTKEYLHHLSIAQGSLAEIQCQLEIARRLGYIASPQSKEIVEICEALAKQMHSLRNALLRKPSIPSPNPDGSPNPNP